MDISYEYEQLPFSLEAEQSVLGAILIDSTCMDTVLKYLTADSFFRKQHKQLFMIFTSLFISGTPIDVITMLNEVKSEHIFDSEQSAKMYLGHLMDMVPSVSNIESYCKIVKDKYYLRTLITVSKDIIDSSRTEEAEAETVLEAAEQKIFEIRQGKTSDSLVHVSEVINREFDHLDKLCSGKERAGISSGFSDLDIKLTGLNPSDLIVVAARPAMGKTSFALNIAVKAAKSSGKEVAVFSLEMSGRQLIERMLASECSIQATKLRTGNLKDDEFAVLAAGAQELASLKLFLDDTPNITATEIKAKLRRLPQLGLVVIDYLQLMNNGRRDGNRVAEISEITRSLKIMAKELNVPIIVLSQLARGPESRQDHRPLLSDLRESGSIEQDADIVMFLYREDYYNPEEAEPGRTELIIAKNRQGEIGTINFVFNSRFTTFRGLDSYHE